MLTIADKTFRSRLFLGTGKFSSPELMARAFRLGVEAGRMACEAKLAPKSYEAVASSPFTSFLFDTKL